VTDVNDLLVGMANLRNAAVAQLCGHGIESLDLSLGLDLVEGVAVGRVGDTEAVDGQCAVASRKSRVDVAVLVVVVRQVPVAEELLAGITFDRMLNLRLVEADTVREKLDYASTALAVLRRDLVVALERLEALEEFCGVVLSKLGEVEREGVDVEVVLDWDLFELALPRLNADGDLEG
jgi:hypothetical protein